MGQRSRHGFGERSEVGEIDGRQRIAGCVVVGREIRIVFDGEDGGEAMVPKRPVITVIHAIRQDERRDLRGQPVAGDHIGEQRRQGEIAGVAG